MCFVSVVFDYGRRMPHEWWTQDRWNEFERLKKAAEKFDTRIGQADCEDPAKAAWMREIEERLARLEGRKRK